MYSGFYLDQFLSNLSGNAQYVFHRFLNVSAFLIQNLSH